MVLRRLLASPVMGLMQPPSQRPITRRSLKDTACLLRMFDGWLTPKYITFVVRVVQRTVITALEFSTSEELFILA